MTLGSLCIFFAASGHRGQFKMLSKPSKDLESHPGTDEIWASRCRRIRESPQHPQQVHAPPEQDFLDGLPGRKLMEFGNYMYTPAYITSNAGRFLDHEWIDLPGML
ncbi:hypothetical protein DFH07DRAFT_780616 [Mycena maculata]|uniref:Uncharacterized protein n=1 Tax=Mycena maculata TaxID=230809 RepID=A0AAD7MW98_9AGAR|nr:hypothetical protein DFH07DRAFT_780616 [Mycena maculata]